MMTLIVAAAVAAQPAPPADQHGQMAPMQHEQHGGMKKDCCEGCCKDTAEEEGGQSADRRDHAGQ